MGVVGAAIKGFGKALKRGYRLKTGIRGKTITGVKPAVKVPGASAKDIERSRQAGHTRVWSQRKKIADDLEKKVARRQKKRLIKAGAHLVKTKVLHKSKLALADTGLIHSQELKVQNLGVLQLKKLEKLKNHLKQNIIMDQRTFNNGRYSTKRK